MTGQGEEEVESRIMPVNAEGLAVGPTEWVYGDGRRMKVAYYATCLNTACDQRKCFFAPSDRQTWVDAHRADTCHPVELTVEPWDLTWPAYVAAYGHTLIPPYVAPPHVPARRPRNSAVQRGKPR